MNNLPERLLSPPDLLIKRCEVKHIPATGNYTIKCFGGGRGAIWRYRGAKEVQIYGSCDTEISGFKMHILIKPSTALNCLEILEGEQNGRQFIIIRGTYKHLGG